MFKPIFEISWKYPYKYKTITPKGKTIYFGNVNYEHYEDTALGHYKTKNHYDEKWWNMYWKWHSKILLKNGQPAYKNPE